MIYVVEVDLALSRPPGVDETVQVVVSAVSESEGRLLACAVASAPVRWDVEPDRRPVMPVGDRVVETRRA